jgi:hypothetical protein
LHPEVAVPAKSEQHERRDTPRSRLTVEAMVRGADDRFHTCRTRDISLDGVFIEAHGETLPKQDKFELAMKLPEAGGHKVYRFLAHVARVTRDGAAVTFDVVDTDAYAALMNLVFSQSPRGSF